MQVQKEASGLHNCLVVIFGVGKHRLGYLVFVPKLSGQQPALTQLRVMALQYSPSLPKDPLILVTFLLL